MDVTMIKKILVCLCFFWTTTPSFAEHKILTGVIQFSEKTSAIPSIKVRAGGADLPCELSQQNKQCIFRLKTKPTSTFFYLVIASQFDARLSGDNTIDYYKVPTHTKYQAYALEYQISAEGAGAGKGSWKVHNFLLPKETRRIPDEAIIVYLDPSYIASIEGGSSIEFPVITIKHNLSELLGSEQAAMDRFDTILLASIDHAGFYSPVQRIFSRLSEKTVGVMTV